MIYLAGGLPRTAEEHLPETVGVMLQPGHGGRPRVGRPWAADNGRFSAPEKYSDDRYLSWLERLVLDQDRCLFATAPDVLADPVATLRLSRPLFPRIRELGYRAALVAQNGLVPSDVPWDEIDALFLGGTKVALPNGDQTEWKLSEAAGLLVAEANRLGKWTHMGRVNSDVRIMIASRMGCRSVDGTHPAREPTKGAKNVGRWVSRAGSQQTLPF